MTERMRLSMELKAITDKDAPMAFEGYGSVFDTVDSYNDTIAKGAYKSTLREWKATGKLPKLLLQHGGSWFSAGAEDMVPIGKWTEMREDDHGLYAKGHLFDVDADRVRLTYAALKAGELDGLSIGFSTRKYKMDEETGIRTLTDIQLYEVSLVTFPANDPARVTGVKAAGDLPTERELERWLQREAGFSDAQAKTIIAKGYRAVQREAASTVPPLGDLLQLLQQRAATFTEGAQG